MFARHNPLLLAVALMLALVAGCAKQAPTAAPASEASAEAVAKVRFHAIVDYDFVKQYAVMPKPENVLLIDSRPKQTKHDNGFIPTSVSIPDSQFDKMTDLLPKDKATLLIFYCEGPTCPLSHKSAWKAEKLGYTNVKVYMGGYPDWMSHGQYASVGTSHVKKLFDDKKPFTLIDARPQAKWDAGHIPGAIHISDTAFDKNTDKLPADKSALLIYYCEGQTCVLSHKSAIKAMKLGYTNVKVYEAGYPEWAKVIGAGDKAAPKAAAQPAAAGSILKPGKVEGSVDIPTFEKIIATNADAIYLIDVRDPAEFKTGTFKGAINIPVDDLEKKAAELKADKPIVFVCSTGARSGESFYMLKDKRPDLKEVYYLEASVTYGKDGSCKIEPTK